MTIRRTVTGLATAILALGCLVAAPVVARADQTRVLALVTAADPLLQGMAFVLIGQMRRQCATAEVTLCGPAGDLARRDLTVAAAPLRPIGVTPPQMLRELLGAGVRIEVRALDLPNAGVGPEALIEGIQPAAPPDMARRMLEPGTRVLPL